MQTDLRIAPARPKTRTGTPCDPIAGRGFGWLRLRSLESDRIRRCFFIIYLALFGSYCGLEVDTFVADTPFFRMDTLLLFFNVLWILMIPPALYTAASSIRHLQTNRIARFVVLFLSSVYFHFAIFLAVYKSVRRIDFDFYFLWYNTADALPTMWKLFAPWFPAVILSILAFTFFQVPAFGPLINGLKRSPYRTGIPLIGLFLISAGCQIATLRSIRGSDSGFLYSSFFSDRRLRDDYTSFYRSNIDAVRSDTPGADHLPHPAGMGDVVFFIKQESLNGFLVNTKFTPQLLRASQDGVLFKKLYANSIQSLRGYECILCGIPPSITNDIVDDYAPNILNDLNCLPRIFKNMGYRTLYFFGGSRNPRIMGFAHAIGFEKVLADDIVKEGDIKFDWGYREDIFFARVHEYLQKRYPHDKLFVFIDTGATNHTPFDVLDESLLRKIPFNHPRAFEEHLANTTFVQDEYFGQFYGIFRKYYAQRGSLLAVSDHAWPMRMHKDNIFNERGAYEENFIIPLLFVPPLSEKARFAVGTKYDYRFSQMDIFPTVLEMIGKRHPRLLGESFAPWLFHTPAREPRPPQKTKISVQPYGGGFISAVRYPEKYLFDVLGRNVRIYNLAKDPEELSPEIHDAAGSMPVIRDFFHPGERN